ncbi:FAD dependent oxidoreductase [Chromobacterium violaceum]|uniref:FAD dependent oxidoreductase n=1 Tax=Chromobacterium violaceum TaxID=536 RepID=A0A447TFB6_CHRVL|nr:FAD dependent oxidoreductase [Chromobacterium violaceum]
MAELTQALAALLGRVNDDYAALIERAGLGHLWRRHGSLTLYRSREEFDAAAPAWDDKRRHGVRWLALGRDALGEGEPVLREEWQYAVQVPAWSHVDDPYVFSRGLFDAFLREGGRFVRDEALATAMEAGASLG